MFTQFSHFSSNAPWLAVNIAQIKFLTVALTNLGVFKAYHLSHNAVSQIVFPSDINIDLYLFTPLSFFSTNTTWLAVNKAEMKFITGVLTNVGVF